MELALLLAAITYMVRGKFDKETSQAAYKAGKEPPSVVKHRRKWQEGGGKLSDSGKPAGPGATRLALSRRWANACEKAKDRSDDKHRRWRQWFAENADQRDQKWREKQTNKIVASEKRAEKFARARGILAHPIAARQERAAWDENGRRDAAAAGGGEDTVADGRGEDAPVEPDVTPADVTPDEAGATAAVTTATPNATQTDDSPVTPDQDAGPDQGSTNGTASAVVPAHSTATTGGTVYQQAAQKLDNHADEIDGYAAALAQLSDDMGGVGWGSEVTEPLADMRTALEQVSTIYSDLAEQILAEGNRVNDAYDEAPWAPDKAALV